MDDHRKTDFTEGTGNVFCDLGRDSLEEELSKASLALQIHDRVEALGLNVTKHAAEWQPRRGRSRASVSAP
jgi:hypothetical protein